MTIDWDTFKDRTTFILGSDKQAGKTTFLKYALACLRAEGGSLACTTIGAEAERSAPSLNQPKPVIVAEPGDVIVTAESTIAQTAALLEILEVFPRKSVLGRQVLARVLRRGQIELAGPENNAQLAQVLDAVSTRTGIDTILVDGAVDRVTQVAASRSRSSYVIVLRADPVNLKSICDRARLLSMLARLECANDEQLAMPDTVLIDGALTQARAGRIPERCKTLVIQDFTRVFLGCRQMLALCSRLDVRVRHRFDLLFFVVNLYDVERDAFQALLGALDVPPRQIVFNPYAECAAC